MKVSWKRFSSKLLLVSWSPRSRETFSRRRFKNTECLLQALDLPCPTPYGRLFGRCSVCWWCCSVVWGLFARPKGTQGFSNLFRFLAWVSCEPNSGWGRQWSKKIKLLGDKISIGNRDLKCGKSSLTQSFCSKHTRPKWSMNSNIVKLIPGCKSSSWNLKSPIPNFCLRTISASMNKTWVSPHVLFGCAEQL